MNQLETFCRQVRARSAEHRLAMSALRGLPGQMVATLRQEVDSLVRVVFVLSLSQRDRLYRAQLIDHNVSGTKWTHPHSRKPVTDREMVELTDTLHGWTRSVYSFGCAFIHLSHLHDYQTRDPLDQLSEAERNSILSHLRNYHGAPHGAERRFPDIIPLLPAVFTKIADNLECYVRQLERDDDLDDRAPLSAR